MRVRIWTPVIWRREFLILGSYYLVRVFLGFPSHRLLVIENRITDVDGTETRPVW